MVNGSGDGLLSVVLWFLASGREVGSTRRSGPVETWESSREQASRKNTAQTGAARQKLRKMASRHLGVILIANQGYLLPFLHLAPMLANTKYETFVNTSNRLGERVVPAAPLGGELLLEVNALPRRTMKGGSFAGMLAFRTPRAGGV